MSSSPASAASQSGAAAAVAVHPPPAALIEWLDLEAAGSAATDKRRAALLLHEAAHVTEVGLGDERAAAKRYASSLTTDPTLQANAWALRRIFMRRGFWQNLTRVLDAEARFVALPEAADRADLLVEKGRVLEDHLDREPEALAAYRAALELDPTHAPAALALLVAGARRRDDALVRRALGAIVSGGADPALRAAAALLLVRAQRRGPAAEGGDDGSALTRAAEGLLRALAAGADAPPLLEELERLSLVSGSAELRLRVLDAFEARTPREGDGERGQLVTARAREKARLLLRRGAREGAVAVLERVARAAPGDPLVIADLMDLAEQAGRADALATAIAGADPQDLALRADAALRQAEIAVRAGALGEAAEACRSIDGPAGYDRVARMLRVRLSTELQDADALAAAFELDADAAERDGDATEAAHQLVRAGTLREVALGDAEGAQRLYRRALERVAGYEPAVEGLAAVLTREGRWAELAQLLEEDLAGVGGSDAERAAGLHDSLAVLYADVLRNPGAALAHRRAAPAGRDVRELVRLVDLIGWAARRGAATADELAAAFDELLAAANDGDAKVVPAVQIAVARALEVAGRGADAEALYRKSFAAQPSSAAAAALEQRAWQLGKPERVFAVLGGELRAAEQAGRAEQARALRFRLAHHAAGAERWEEALAVLEPLRRARDDVAAAWSLDIARRSGSAELVVTSVREALGASTSDDALPEPEAAPVGRWLALAEALSELGRGDAAHVAFERAAAAARSVPRAIDAGLGVLRQRAAAADGPGVVGALEWLAAVSPAEEAGAIADEARLCALAAGEPYEEQAASEGNARVAFLAAATTGDPVVMLGARERLAAELAPVSQPLAAELLATVGLRKLLLGEGDAEEVLARAAAAGDPSARVALTDVLPAELAEHAPARAARAERSGVDPELAPLAVVLWLEEAEAAELAGRSGEAATAYRRALELDARSLPALEGLRRLANAAGDRVREARLLERIGRVVQTPLRSAQALAEAALLLEAEGDHVAAADLFLQVLERTPDDDEAYHRLARLLEGAEDWRRLEGLLSFKVGRTKQGAERATLYEQRAALRLDRLVPAAPTDEAREAIERGALDDYKRALKLDARRFTSLHELAKLALAGGHAAIAARLLERALPEAPNRDAEALCRSLLAAAHEADGNLVAAAATLSALVLARPEDAGARERLVSIHVRQGDFTRAVEQLRAHLHELEAAATDAPARAAVHLRIGRLARDQMGAPDLALAAFRAALELDPLGDAAAELGMLVPRHTTVPAPEAAAIDVVLARLRADLARAPLDARLLERVAELARVRDRGELGAVVGQVLALLGQGSEPGRPRDLVSGVDLATLHELAAPTPGALLAAWPHLAEVVARWRPLEPASLGIGRATRVASDREPRLTWVEAAARALGITELTLHLGGQVDDRDVVALDQPEPTLLVGRGLLGGDSGARFRVGRALAWLRLSAASAMRLSEDELGAAIAAALAAALGEPVRGMPAPSKPELKAASRALARRDAKALVAASERFGPEALDVRALRRGIERAGERFGLLLAGDAGSAARAVAGKGAVDASAPALELVAFALGDAYLTLRRRVGLVQERGDHRAGDRT